MAVDITGTSLVLSVFVMLASVALVVFSLPRDSHQGLRTLLTSLMLYLGLSSIHLARNLVKEAAGTMTLLRAIDVGYFIAVTICVVYTFYLVIYFIFWVMEKNVTKQNKYFEDEIA